MSHRISCLVVVVVVVVLTSLGCLNGGWMDIDGRWMDRLTLQVRA